MNSFCLFRVTKIEFIFFRIIFSVTDKKIVMLWYDVIKIMTGIQLYGSNDYADPRSILNISSPIKLFPSHILMSFRVIFALR